jgi:dTDP-4-dehydrorhamnose 3,5-epimerase
MIEGVVLKPLRVIPDERGWLMEIIRRDDPFFVGFGQSYLTAIYPGVVKGWHYHKKQSDNMAVVRGMMKIVLYDSREGSKTFGEVNEFFAGVHNPILVHIPPLVFHGFKCISQEEAIVVNTPTDSYSYREPDEFRVHPHQNDIPYDWERKDG